MVLIFLTLAQDVLSGVNPEDVNGIVAGSPAPVQEGEEAIQAVPLDIPNQPEVPQEDNPITSAVDPDFNPPSQQVRGISTTKSLSNHYEKNPNLHLEHRIKKKRKKKLTQSKREKKLNLAKNKKSSSKKKLVKTRPKKKQREQTVIVKAKNKAKKRRPANEK